jgi:thioredoxin reductase (NADPH)
VAVIGGGNSATEESLFLLKFVDRVTLMVRGDEFKASQLLVEKVMSEPRIDVRFNTEVTEFHGAGGKLKSVTIKDNQTSKTEAIQPAGVFVFIGLTPNTGFLTDTPIKMDQWGFVITGHELVHTQDHRDRFATRLPLPLETSVPGIFAAGDVRAGSTKQVASAAGEGATVALFMREYLECGVCQQD